MNSTGTVILIPSYLDEPDANTLPPAILQAVKKCGIFFVENERSARRFLKSIWKEMEIDAYQWFTIHKAETEVKQIFLQKLKEGKTIGIISEAGCPGIADPGQILIDAAQRAGVRVMPVVGPNSIILALMASGLNGQKFSFHGYLPIDVSARNKLLRELESISARDNSTQIFIETPYRNKALVDAILSQCKTETRLCIAVNLTGINELVETKTVKEWKISIPELHKRPAIFLIYAGVI